MEVNLFEECNDDLDIRSLRDVFRIYLKICYPLRLVFEFTSLFTL